MLKAMLAFAQWGGVLTVVVLALITGVDVIGRYVFNHPIFGANDLIEIMMGVLFACGIAVTAAHDDYISVDSVYDKLSASGKQVLRVFGSLVITFLYVILAWQGYQGGVIGLKTSKVSTTLEIPLAPFKFFLALGFLFSLIFSIKQLIHLLRGEKREDISSPLS